jgi:zinc protease
MSHRLLTFLAFILSMAGVGTAFGLSPVMVEGYSYVKTVGDITEYRLEANGLQVLVMPEHSAPVVTFMVTYRVGSRNEVTGTTGATHLLEHLMFKGTTNFNRTKGNGYDQLLERVGAVTNATTWLDRTNYYANIGSDHLAMAVELEADRMRNLLLRDEDRQPEMTVVRNEFEQGENNPSSALTKEIFQAAYVAHPYHHSTIGWRSDIEKVSIEKLREFYDTFYWPDNATVSIVGDFDVATALQLVKRYFGPIPRAPKTIPEVYTEEPAQTFPRRVGIKRAGELGVVAIGHKIPNGGHADYPALSVLSSILTNGKNSRLYRALTDKNLTTGIRPFLGFNRDNSLHIVFAPLAPGVTHETVERALLAEIERIKREGVTDQEVATAISKILADAAFQRDGSFAVAENLNECIASGDWTTYYSVEEQTKKVTAADVKRVANMYLVEEQSTTGWFVPVQEPAGAGENGPAASQPVSRTRHPAGPYYYRDPAHSHTRLEDSAKTPNATSSTKSAASFARNVVEDRVAGIQVLQYKTGVKDVVTLRGSLPAGDALSPSDNVAIATLAGNMLDKGTVKADKFAISQKLEAVGATVRFSVSNYTLQIEAQCLKKDTDLVLGLIAEMLREPAFSMDEFAKLKTQLIGALRRSLESPDFRASEAFNRAIYPAGHPNREASVQEFIAAVEAATLDQVKAFHAKHYGPKRMILVAVGDIDPAQNKSTIAAKFGGWTGGSDVPIAPPPRHADTAKEQVVFMSDKPSVAVVLGQATQLNYNHPDFHALRIGTAILGSGFTGRLMAKVRDEEGLTYGIAAGHLNDTYNTGHWSIFASFAPELLQKGLDATRRELRNWYADGVTQQELELRKTNVIGSFKVNLSTTTGMAEQLLINAERGKTPEFLDRYPELIAALTVDQVNAAIRKHLNPENMIVIQAGSVPGASIK